MNRFFQLIEELDENCDHEVVTSSIWSIKQQLGYFENRLITATERGNLKPKNIARIEELLSLLEGK